MKQKQTLYIMAGCLAVSAGLIAGLANANITTDYKNKSVMHTKKLITIEDGEIGLDELTARQDYRFAKLDRDESGTIEKHEFNARLITMFHRMDRDGDGVLQGDELPGHRYGGTQHQHGDKASDSTKNS